MKGVVFLGKSQCVVKELTTPEPSLGQVLVRLKAAGLCGSDLHLYRGLSKEEAERRGDRVPGHEPAGVVERVGQGVSRVKVGDRVSVYHYLGCGHCKYCASGYLPWCREARGYGGAVNGAHADFLLADERNCVPLPAPLTFGDGAFIACAGGTAYSALKKLALTSGQTILVVGLGPVGLSAVLLAKAMRARVIGVDLVQERLELAHKLGAQAALPAAAAPVAALQRLTDGQGVDAAIETSGSTDGRRNLLAALRRGGRAAFLGVGSREPVINPTDLIHRQLTLMGSFVLPLGMAWELVEFLVNHQLSFEPAVTHRFRIEQAPEAYRLFETGKTGKVMFVWEG
ncbi:MAG: zinc-binding dehydrogenase [Planctomycetes bacterium]|nr:zinc-binding dehydrogenase [Planctomycetota bacterium]MBM4078606.1 zinc-binding dehydrogenase [Planctomycetota bacterium]